jgi:hypothetical protein
LWSIWRGRDALIFRWKGGGSTEHAIDEIKHRGSSY